MRCICVTSVVFNGEGTGILAPHAIRNEIPNALLYWDSLTVPILAAGMAPELDADIEMLEGEGCATSWYYKQRNSFSSNDAHAFAGHFVDGISQRLRDKEHRWSLIIPRNTDIDLPSYQAHLEAKLGSNTNRSKTISLTLLNSLPVCPPDTPYLDIIDFKRKRSDHLNNLHSEIDHLSASLSGSDDLEYALHVAKERVAAALLELDRVLSERWSSRVLSSLRTNTGSIAAGALAGAGTAGATGLSLPLMAMAGGAAGAAIEAVVNGLMTPRNLPERAAPYLYAIEAQRALAR